MLNTEPWMHWPGVLRERGRGGGEAERELDAVTGCGWALGRSPSNHLHKLRARTGRFENPGFRDGLQTDVQDPLPEHMCGLYLLSSESRSDSGSLSYLDQSLSGHVQLVPPLYPQ